MKKILSKFFVMIEALCFALALYQSNQYLQVQAAVGPSLAQLNSLGAAGAEALGIDATQLESTKQMLTATSNSMLQGILLDFVLGIIFLLAGYFTYPEKG